MWFWTECSDLIGSERLYIPHSLNACARTSVTTTTSTYGHFWRTRPANVPKLTAQPHVADVPNSPTLVQPRR